jgi:hypothetical protein
MGPFRKCARRHRDRLLIRKERGALGGHRAGWDPFAGALEVFTHMEPMVQYSV